MTSCSEKQRPPNGCDMLDQRMFKNLASVKKGIWVPRCEQEVAGTSYPADGHKHYFSLEEKSFWFEHRNRCIVAILRRFPPQGCLLDVGGGNGYVSLGIQNAGFPVVMLESGINGVMNAHSRGVVNIIHSTFEDAQFPRTSIGSVGMFDVLEHIEDDYSFLLRVRRCIVASGKLYITVPAHRYLWSSMDADAGHFRRYSAASLERMLRKAGFKVIYCSYFFSGLSIPILFCRTLPTFFKLPPTLRVSDTPASHKKRQGFLGSLIAWHWKREIEALKAGKVVCGSSIVAVAEAA